MKYLKQFIIGSSFLVFAPFYYAVQNNQPKKTYNYYTYTLLAPVWFGVWNIISLILAQQFNLSMRERFLLISVISSFSIMALATYLQSYRFTRKEWTNYYKYIFIKYILVWNIIVYNLEKKL